MKQKKQIKIIISLLVMIAVLLGGWGFMNHEGLKAEERIKKNEISMDDKVKDLRDSSSYLSNFPKWKNSLTDLIPSDFTFSPIRTLDTEFEVIEGLREEESVYYFTDVSANSKHVLKVTNVGTYNGESISMKMTLILSADGVPGSGRIFTDYGAGFLNVSVGVLAGYQQTDKPFLEVTYEFFKDTSCEVPIKLSGYFNFNNMNGKAVRLDNNIVESVFSVKPESAFPGEELVVSENGSWVTIASQNSPGTSNSRLQNQFTVTFGGDEGTDTFSWGLVVKSLGSFNDSYHVIANGETIVKIEIPSPVGVNSLVDTIVSDKSDMGAILDEKYNEISFQFTQYIPNEMRKTMYWDGSLTEPYTLPYAINNMNQKMDWTLTSPVDSETVKLSTSSILEITNERQTGEDNDNSNHLFNTSIEGLDIKITPKENPPQESDFYNHYYTFKGYVEIDYNEPVAQEVLVQPEELDGKPLTSKGNYYLAKKYSVALTSTNPNNVYSDDFTSWINFESNVTYEFYDEHGVKKYSYDSKDLDYAADLTSIPLITHEAPLLSATKLESLNTTFKADNYAIAPTDPTYELAVADATVAASPPVGITHQLQCTDGNVVKYTLQPLYTVDVQVGALDTDGNFGTIPFAPSTGTNAPYVTVAEKTAPQVPTEGTQTGTDADFTFADYPFDVGTKSYQVKQVAAVNENYDMPDDGIAIDFSINSSSQLVVGTDVVTTKEGEIFVYKDTTKPYILQWDPATKKLTIQMINFPQGEVEIEGVEIEGEYRVDDIDFGNVTIPAQADIVRVPKKKDDDHFPSLVVVDTRLPAYRKDGWRLSVYMSKAFTATEGTDKIEGILYYKSQSPDSTPIPFDEGTTPVPIEALTPEAGTAEETDPVWRTPIALGSAIAENGLPKEGFYLYIDKQTQLGIIAGEYQAELTFSVENSAFTTPTP